MKPTDFIKVPIFGLLLVVIFSFPLVTATQLVKVLGTSVNSGQLDIKMLGDTNTFVSQQGDSYTIYYITPGNHEVMEFKNDTLTLQPANLSVSGRVGSEVKILLAGQKQGSLTPNNSDLPISFSLNPGQAAALSIEVVSSQSASSGVLTVSLKK